jgi:anaerobic selenocysteine-containing dehydrogenase
VQPDDTVEIASKRASIPSIVEADDTLRRGLVSMAFGFGDAPDRDGEFRDIGSSTNRLLTNTDFIDRYSGQPLMSNIPVSVRPLDESRLHEPARPRSPGQQ